MAAPRKIITFQERGIDLSKRADYQKQLNQCADDVLFEVEDILRRLRSKDSTQQFTISEDQLQKDFSSTHQLLTTVVKNKAQAEEKKENLEPLLSGAFEEIADDGNLHLHGRYRYQCDVTLKIKKQLSPLFDVLCKDQKSLMLEAKQGKVGTSITQPIEDEYPEEDEDEIVKPLPAPPSIKGLVQVLITPPVVSSGATNTDTMRLIDDVKKQEENKNEAEGATVPSRSDIKSSYYEPLASSTLRDKLINDYRTTSDWRRNCLFKPFVSEVGSRTIQALRDLIDYKVVIIAFDKKDVTRELDGLVKEHPNAPIIYRTPDEKGSHTYRMCWRGSHAAYTLDAAQVSEIDFPWFQRARATSFFNLPNPVRNCLKKLGDTQFFSKTEVTRDEVIDAIKTERWKKDNYRRWSLFADGPNDTLQVESNKTATDDFLVKLREQFPQKTR